ncbi:hypothetical protein PanWU01x14_251530 [Parasponia andersonii]|uniref:Uncharacterized protein n=1 Tax=Parasponia andersonii TaxID=3476 RepID=A0A2P5BCI8_PARAD|nr:hypothetical protein PanWU01x14_251530 [Parasponia andersonii]
MLEKLQNAGIVNHCEFRRTATASGHLGRHDQTRSTHLDAGSPKSTFARGLGMKIPSQIWNVLMKNMKIDYILTHVS